MRLEEDKIIIESRYEIDDIKDMITCYLRYGEPQKLTEAELERLRDKLDALFISW